MLLGREQIIHNTQQVQELVQQNRQHDVSKQLVAQIFRQELGLKYKMVRRIAYNANTEKSLALRSMFSQ